MSWTLTSIRTYMRLHLSGAATPSDDEIGRAWIHALGDFSRFVPRERMKMYVLDFDEVADEQVTLTAHGTVISFANKPIKWDSERICDDAAETTTYTRDTDYTIDYINGTITSISTGDIGATDTIYCNYTISKQALDVSGLTDLYRIKNVFYPYGEVPEDVVRYRLFAGFLTILGKKSGTTPSQSQGTLVDGKQLLLEYYANHTAPESGTAGSAPEWSNEIILKGCEAYSYLIEANSYEQLAATQIAAAVTALGNISHSAATTALGAGSSALAAATTTLALIATPADFHALADAALDVAAVQLGKIVADSTNGELYDARLVEDIEPGSEGDFWLDAAGTIDAKAFLTAGQALINAVNKGEDVSQRNLDYANTAMALHDRYRALGQLHLERAAARTQAALGYVQESMARMRQVEQIVAEGQTEVAAGNGYARVGETYEADISNSIREVEAFLAAGMQYFELSDKYRDLGVLRRNEYWMILTDRSQHGTEKSSTSGTQMP